MLEKLPTRVPAEVVETGVMVLGCFEDRLVELSLFADEGPFSGGMRSVVVSWIDGGEVLWDMRDGGASSIDDANVIRLFLVERFVATEALRARTGDFDGVAYVLAVLTLIVKALETGETDLLLFVDWTTESLLLADEGPPDAVLKVEDASLIVEVRDWGLGTESVGLSPGPMVLRSVFNGVGAFRYAAALDLIEGVRESIRSAGLLDTLLRVTLDVLR